MWESERKAHMGKKLPKQERAADKPLAGKGHKWESKHRECSKSNTRLWQRHRAGRTAASSEEARRANHRHLDHHRTLTSHVATDSSSIIERTQLI